MASGRKPVTCGNFENDTWQLFHTDTDRSEAHDLADQHPDKVRQLVDLWYAEAGKYEVLPLDDRTVAELVAVQPEALIPPGGVYVYYPGTLEVPEFSAANIRGRSYKILAEVQLTDPDASGVILAQGARFGGHALFVKDRKLWYVYNFIGIPPEQQLIADRELAAGNRVLGVEFTKERLGERHETHGTAKLYVDDQVVAEGPLRTQPGHFALAGEGLSVGRDTGDAVSKEYTPSSPSPADGSSRSRSASATTCTSTSNANSPPPWPATSNSGRLDQAGKDGSPGGCECPLGCGQFEE